MQAAAAHIILPEAIKPSGPCKRGIWPPPPPPSPAQALPIEELNRGGKVLQGGLRFGLASGEGEGSRERRPRLVRAELPPPPAQPGTQAKLPAGSNICFELFAGSARFSAAMRSLNYHTVSVDWIRNRADDQSNVLQLDLTQPAAQQIIFDRIDEGGVAGILLAPPCGTASRAREIRRRAGPDPQPLRSSDFPRGLPHVHGADLVRLQSANQLYDFTAAVFTKCALLGVPCVMENPLNSLFWQVDTIAACKLLPSAQWCA